MGRRRFSNPTVILGLVPRICKRFAFLRRG